MNLPSPKSTKKSKIKGRGTGSGVGGHTTGRGTKGQKSRSGYKKPRLYFEGGQNPITKRLPKLKGMANAARSNRFKTSKVANVSLKLSELVSKFKEGEAITFEKLIEMGIVKPMSHKVVSVKVLFDKEIDRKVEIEGLDMSEKAVDAVTKAGGSVK
jgi:large subunit ribosomal protein L15